MTPHATKKAAKTILKSKITFKGVLQMVIIVPIIEIPTPRAMTLIPRTGIEEGHLRPPHKGTGVPQVWTGTHQCSTNPARRLQWEGRRAPTQKK